MVPPSQPIAAAAVRAQFDPRPGDRGAVERACQGCGERFLKWRGSKRYYCPTCAYTRQAEAQAQHEAKSGPAWEANVRGNLTFWLAEAQRLGLIE